MTRKQIQKEVKEIKASGHELSKSKKKAKAFLKSIDHDELLKLSNNEILEETDLEKLEENFRRTLYRIDGLSSEGYNLADAIKEYVDRRFELLELKNKKL